MQPIIRQLFCAFLLGVLVGLCLGGLLWSHHPAEPRTNFPDPRQEKAQLAESEHRYQRRFDSLDHANRSLQLAVRQTRAALNQATTRNRSLQGTIKDLLTVHYTTTDTVTRLANCDSMATTVDSMLTQQAVKDSLYADLTDSLQGQVALRDSTTLLQQAQYDSLQSAYRKLLTAEDALLRENAAQQKTIRRQKRGKGLLTTVVLAFAGLFVYSAIK